MEFPDLGENCAYPPCNQLDFLPFKCDACSKQFCLHHFRYEEHKCELAGTREFQLPVCPLCDKQVPMSRDQSCDAVVGAHIDRDCKSERKPKIYTNRCNVKGCRRKEIIQMVCGECNTNFCIRHRLPADHSCTPGTNPSRAGAAALSRLVSSSKKSSQSTGATPRSGTGGLGRSIQSGMTDEEALAKAIELSLRETRLQSSASQLPQDCSS